MIVVGVKSRREPPHLILELMETPAPVTYPREGLPSEKQAAAVTTLALLMAKAVARRQIREEGDHE